jgi:anti-sigma regulatory factor (Ser/Thr protein kinase)
MQDVMDTFGRSYQATPAAIGCVRADIAAFAAARGAEPAHVDDIRLAVSEAVTNAVMHGYREMNGIIQVTARHTDGALSISIRDFGCGMQPRPLGSGRTGMGLGLALIGRVVTELSVALQGGDGTEVSMRFDLEPAAARAERLARAAVA